MSNNLLEKCDLVGSEIQLYHKGSSRVKTTLGGLFSVILLIFTLFCISYFGSDIVQKQKPTYRFYKEYSNESTIAFPDFPLMIILTTNTGAVIKQPERYYYMDAVYYVLELDQQSKTFKSRGYSLYVEQCNSTMYPKYKELIDSPSNGVPVSSAYCINPNKINYLNGTIGTNETLYALNEFGNLPSRFAFTRLHICKNTTENGNSCATPAEIDALMTMGTYISVFYVDNYINLNFYENPYVSFITNYAQAITKGICKANHIKVKTTKIFTDSGIILEDTDEINFHQVEGISSDLINNPDSLVLFYIETTKMSDNYSRKYVKIQDLIANIGGLIKFLFTIASVIMSFYSEAYFTIDIANSLFQVRGGEEDNNHLSRSNVIKSESRSVIPAFNFTAINNREKSFRNIDVSLGDYIKSFIFCKSKYKREQYRSLQTLINGSLEVRKIISSIFQAPGRFDKISLLINDNNFTKEEIAISKEVESSKNVQTIKVGRKVNDIIKIQ
jgi:hypothetical protein